MNIKSHLKLASSIAKSSRSGMKTTEKISFMFGNILPDITCSFLKYPHIPSVMYPCVMSAIKKYLADIDNGIYPTWLQTGVITHYLADFFTSAHNAKFGFNRRAHYIYEQILERKLKEFILKNDLPSAYPNSENNVIQIITQLHKEYVNSPLGFERDVQFITKACNYYAGIIELRIREGNHSPVGMEDVLVKSV